MSNKEYNGWTNYATWRVNLEVFDGFDADGEVYDADMVEEVMDQLLNDEAGEDLIRGYAEAFLADVNWHEVAEMINEINEE